MLQAGRSDGEFQGFLVAWQVKQSEDQSAREAVAASHAIHDMGDFVMAAEQKLAAIVQACGPAVMRRALRFAQSDGQHLQTWIRIQHPFRQRTILCGIDLARMHIHASLDTERGLAIFFVRDSDIH